MPTVNNGCPSHARARGAAAAAVAAAAVATQYHFWVRIHTLRHTHTLGEFPTRMNTLEVTRPEGAIALYATLQACSLNHL
jgi:hypothetical protein